VLDNVMWTTPKKILLHPVGYIMLGDKVEMFKQRLRRLYYLKKVTKRLAGFDTADSNKISMIFVDVLNHLDFVIVPSSWAMECYVNSGVETDVFVLPHGLNEPFLKDSREITNDAILKLQQIKKKHKAKFVLFFLLHSEFRKGADFVKEAISTIQQERDDVILVVKSQFPINYFNRLRSINITGWLSDDELRQLYDVCDVLVCPSRGGGFELNALEGIARGLPTLVPNGMCFLDYIQYAIPIKLKNKVVVLPNNPIHVGHGYEIDVEDFTKKLKRVLDNLGKHKRQFKKNAKVVRERYAWNVICDKLYNILSQYEFV